ncbi:hypothetical protein FNV43_RR06515 [Rhamnella rubrinervis]|uniref:Uncharacterized protein n=1 Tax=Rhamnella rubrinervis TaxID=2594499 RepID=A0A8K0HEP9_9ROSA|nr:hypothetical protein FNV43_RR06515 [Rhamnella rubrinervis]
MISPKLYNENWRGADLKAQCSTMFFRVWFVILGAGDITYGDLSEGVIIGMAQGFKGPPVVAAISKEDLVEDTEEDFLGIEDCVPDGYSPEPIDQEDFDP